MFMRCTLFDFPAIFCKSRIPGGGAGACQRESSLGAPQLATTRTVQGRKARLAASVLRCRLESPCSPSFFRAATNNSEAGSGDGGGDGSGGDALFAIASGSSQQPAYQRSLGDGSMDGWRRPTQVLGGTSHWQEGVGLYPHPLTEAKKRPWPTLGTSRKAQDAFELTRSNPSLGLNPSPAPLWRMMPTLADALVFQSTSSIDPISSISLSLAGLGHSPHS